MSDDAERLILLKENFYYLQLLTGRGLQFPREGMPCPIGPQGEAPVSVGRQNKSAKKSRVRTFLMFFTEKAR